MKAIVITISEDEVKDMQPDHKNAGFWGQPIMDYNCEWHWVVDGDDISGTSGYNSLQHAIKTHPGTPIYYYQHFKSLKTTPLQ